MRTAKEAGTLTGMAMALGAILLTVDDRDVWPGGSSEDPGSG